MNILDLFHIWYKQGANQTIPLLLIGGAAIYWTILLARNEMVFDNSRRKLFCRSCSGGMHWLQGSQWQEENKE